MPPNSIPVAWKLFTQLYSRFVCLLRPLCWASQCHTHYNKGNTKRKHQPWPLTFKINRFYPYSKVWSKYNVHWVVWSLSRSLCYFTIFVHCHLDISILTSKIKRIPLISFVFTMFKWFLFISVYRTLDLWPKIQHFSSHLIMGNTCAKFDYNTLNDLFSGVHKINCHICSMWPWHLTFKDQSTLSSHYDKHVW